MDNKFVSFFFDINSRRPFWQSQENLQLRFVLILLEVDWSKPQGSYRVMAIINFSLSIKKHIVYLQQQRLIQSVGHL